MAQYIIGITSPNTIQPGEHSKGGGRDDILHILRNPDGNLNVLYLNWNGSRRLALIFSVGFTFPTIACCAGRRSGG